nr:MAG TPA: hypothetical protein [Caudoviricetes sp.]
MLVRKLRDNHHPTPSGLPPCRTPRQTPPDGLAPSLTETS